MRITFFHDTTFIKQNQEYYTKGQVNSKYLYKYLKYLDADKITTVIREEGVNEKNKNYIKSENLITDDIKVTGVKYNYSNASKKVKQEMLNCDFAIIRMPSIIGIFACNEARKRGIPYLIEMVGCPQNALWYHGGIKYKIFIPFITIINKIYIKKAKYVIYVTKSYLQKKYPTKGKSIACSDVNLPELDSKILKNRIKKIKEIDENKVYKLGLIGSLNVDYKGHEMIIKAISNLNKRNIEIHFLGTGNKEKWIKLAQKYNVENRIFFDGILPHDRVFEWMKEIDIYLLLSKTEGLPRALIEAMGCACPSICTNVGGVPELIDPKYLVRSGDSNKLAEKINELLNNKERLISIAKENFYKTKEYQETELDKKRIVFYNLIMKGIKNDKSFTCVK